MKIIVLSDTHGLHERVSIPEGDLLIHAGDLTAHGSLRELSEFDRFLARLPHRHKIVIAGNHDWCFQRQPQQARSVLKAAIYLQDESTVVEGLRIYGSPWQPWFMDWAFNLPRGEALRRIWAAIPDGTDVLVTHGPPFGILDRTARGMHAGCQDLLDRVRDVRPALHVFGHIHEAYGQAREGTTLFVNASVCTLRYAPVQPAVTLDYRAGLEESR
ncbi:MAG: metallophosphoesterase family protein [Armatimonadetes bacterium]|nr:metallophosphoesterase family protein [Armatimonadota bacterium]